MISCTIQVTFDRDGEVARKAGKIIKAAYPYSEVSILEHSAMRMNMMVNCSAGVNLENLEKFVAATLTSCGGKEVRV